MLIYFPLDLAFNIYLLIVEASLFAHIGATYNYEHRCAARCRLGARLAHKIVRGATHSVCSENTRSSTHSNVARRREICVFVREEAAGDATYVVPSCCTARLLQSGAPPRARSHTHIRMSLITCARAFCDVMCARCICGIYTTTVVVYLLMRYVIEGRKRLGGE